MPDEHEFFPQPHGPPCCFCRDRACPGWAAYTAWYRDCANETGEPDDGAIETHMLFTRTLATLVRYYSELLGREVDANTALDLADIDRTAELHRR